MKLEKELEGLNPERKRKTLEFKWPEPARTDKTVLAAADLTFGFSKDKALWKPLTFNLYRGQKIALAGPNGCGKSTLIKLAVGDLKPWSGATWKWAPKSGSAIIRSISWIFWIRKSRFFPNCGVFPTPK